ncbi:ribosomal L23 (chloroplast), partial [Olea europaea subsp. europaea]
KLFFCVKVIAMNSHRLSRKAQRMGPIMGHTMLYRYMIVTLQPGYSRKSYALEEACTIWEGVLIDQKE